MGYKDISEWILDLVFPARCLSCGQFGVKDYCCRKCLNSVPIKTNFECLGCGRPSAGGLTCFECRDHWALDQLFVVSDYRLPLVQNLIKGYKYKFLKEVYQPLAQLAFKYGKLLEKRKSPGLFYDSPFLVPVPLHIRRLRWRGFNQAEYLAAALALNYHLDCRPDLLFRNKISLPQAEIEEREKRLGNVAEVFSCPDPEAVRGRSILLIDDVCTTGATLNECAKVLKSAGAKYVKALVIARG